MVSKNRVEKEIARFSRGTSKLRDREVAVLQLLSECKLLHAGKWDIYSLQFCAWSNSSCRSRSLQDVHNGTKPSPDYTVRMTEDSWELLYIVPHNGADGESGILCQVWIPYLYGQVPRVVEHKYMFLDCFMNATPAASLDTSEYL